MPGRPNLDGGAGGGGGGGGGVPGTGTGSTSTQGGLPVNENGGVFGSTWFLMVPSQSVTTGLCFVGFFDIDSYDDAVDASYYSYRAEDILPDAVPTVNRVILTYRDLGLAKLTVTLSGTNDNGEVKNNSVKIQIGNKIPTDELLTKFVDIQLTAFRPQLTLSRKAGGGPFCITAVRMMGEVEEVK